MGLASGNGWMSLAIGGMGAEPQPTAYPSLDLARA